MTTVEHAPTFTVIGEDIALADQAFEALTKDATVDTFRRGRLLVRVVDNGVIVKRVNLPGGLPIIEPISFPMLRERLARLGAWEKVKSRGSVACMPPDWLVQTIFARASWQGLPILEAVVESPVMREDGSILSQPGYDTASRLVYYANGSSADYPAIPANPTLEEAKVAAISLLEPISDFPFRSASDRAAALAAILSLVGRHAIAGCVPMFVIRSPAPGNGKSLLADVISIIGTGRPAPRVCPDDDQTELKKLILAIALAGMSCVLLDNLTGRVGSKGISSALTAETWQDRHLGESKMIEAPIRAVWIATGNNLSFKGDLGRRVICCDLDSGLEHPEDRPESTFSHPNLLEYVQKNRPRLVSAALLILRAFHVANRPLHPEPKKGSFEAWDELVRSALIWVGVGDPDAGKERLRDDDDTDIAYLREAIEETHRATLGEFFSLAELVAKADQDDDLKNALLQMTGKEKLTVNNLGYSLRANRDRVSDGKSFKRRKKDERKAKWFVQTQEAMLL